MGLHKAPGKFLKRNNFYYFRYEYYFATGMNLTFLLCQKT